jgi:hypothetical protein
MNAPVEDIVPPSRITVAALAIAQSVRRARERWIEARRGELLPSPYVHVVFTLPPQLAALTLQNTNVIYGLLLRASAETLLHVARNPRHLGADIGFFSVLHTWNQKLEHHPRPITLLLPKTDRTYKRGFRGSARPVIDIYRATTQPPVGVMRRKAAQTVGRPVFLKSNSSNC